MMRPTPRISVVLCADESTPFDDLTSAVGSVLSDDGVHEVLVVVDRAPRLRDHLRHRFDDLVVVDNTRAPGLAGSRDTGIESARGDVVAFLAADAVAHAGWAAALAAPFDEVDVIAVVGRTEPTFSGVAPSVVPSDLLWAVGCTPRSRPDGLVALDGVAGSAVAFRRWDLLQVGGLASGVAARETSPRGVEMVELCLRLAADEPEARIVSTSTARVSRTVRRAETRVRSITAAAFDRGVVLGAVRRSTGADVRVAGEVEVSASVVVRSAARSLVGARRGTGARIAAAVGLLVGGVVGALRGTRVDVSVDDLEPLRSATVRH